MKLKDIEREAILSALEKAEFNRTQAAHNLGISIRTLRYKLKEYESQGFIKSYMQLIGRPKKRIGA